MSKHKHTPEPWARRGDMVYTVEDEPGQAACVADCHAPNTEEAAANADRIVACVNACAGINPAAVPKLLKLVLAVAEWDNSPDSGHETLNRLGLIATAALCEASK